MTANKTDGIYNLTQPAVLLFTETLFEAKPFIKNGKPKGEAKFGCNVILSPTHADIEGMKQTAAKVARARWPDKAFTELKFPFTPGDKSADKRKANGKNDAEHLRGQIVINTKSKYQPRLSVIDNGKIIDLDTDLLKAAHKSKFYNGVEALIQLNFVAYEKGDEDAKDGVTAYLNIVVSTGKGKRLSGGATASDVFKGYVGSVSAEDPTAGEDSLAGIM